MKKKPLTKPTPSQELKEAPEITVPEKQRRFCPSCCSGNIKGVTDMSTKELFFYCEDCAHTIWRDDD